MEKNIKAVIPTNIMFDMAIRLVHVLRWERKG